MKYKLSNKDFLKLQNMVCSEIGQNINELDEKTRNKIQQAIKVSLMELLLDYSEHLYGNGLEIFFDENCLLFACCSEYYLYIGDYNKADTYNIKFEKCCLCKK